MTERHTYGHCDQCGFEKEMAIEEITLDAKCEKCGALLFNKNDLRSVKFVSLFANVMDKLGAAVKPKDDAKFDEVTVTLRVDTTKGRSNAP
ncbi:hypothetical protein FACS1894110_10120 [Spirochaetia bacterium]|nr:hypothetical protein FACS1894110_10120 [Spirochaetia bacterium]